MIDTAAKLAAEHKVAPRTIKRDGDYAKAIDAIAETAGPQARTAIFQRDSGLTKQEVAALAEQDEETQVAVISSAEERTAWKRPTAPRWRPTLPREKGATAAGQHTVRRALRIAPDAALSPNAELSIP